MDQQETSPTTQEHELLANQLMQDLEFEWDPTDERWYFQANWQTQGMGTRAVKRLLETATDLASEPPTAPKASQDEEG